MKEDFISRTRKKLAADFAVGNLNAQPTLTSISVSLRLGRFKDDLKAVEAAKKELEEITGQRPSLRRAKKAVSSFKIKEGDLVALAVTLRGKRMWAFLEKLVKVVLPAVRDFKGIRLASLDGQGNLSLGFREQTVFPEIDPNKVDRLRGLGVSLTTSLKGREPARKFFESLGFVFSRF